MQQERAVALDVELVGLLGWEGVGAAGAAGERPQGAEGRVVPVRLPYDHYSITFMKVTIREVTFWQPLGPEQHA